MTVMTLIRFMALFSMHATYSQLVSQSNFNVSCRSSYKHETIPWAQFWKQFWVSTADI